MNLRKKYINSINLLIISTVVVNLAIAFTSYRYFLFEKETMLHEKSSQIRSIADIKINQIADWLNERFSDARYLAASPQVTESIQLLIKDPQNSEYQMLLHNNLNGMYLNGKYESMAAVTTTGHVLFAIPKDQETVRPYLKLLTMNQAVNPGRIWFHKAVTDSDNIARTQITVPLVEARFSDTLAIGWLLLNINLETDFFTLLENITLPTKTLEVLMVYEHLGKLVYLNKPNLTPSVIADLRKNQDMQSLPALKAILGFEGTGVGKDLNGIPVLYCVLPVPDFDAFLMVKMDISEVYEDIRKIRISILIMATSLIIALTSSVYFFWLRQRSEWHRLELEKSMISERFDMLSKFANDAIILCANDLTILQVNDKALELYGYTRQEILGMNAELLKSPDNRKTLKLHIEEARSVGGQRYETMHQRKDGHAFPVEISSRYIEIMGSECFQSIIRDITQRKQFEKALVESEQRLRLITNTMPQIVWTTRPDGSFDFVNSRFEVLTGLHPYKDRWLDDSIYPEDYERVKELWNVSLAGNTEFQFRLRLLMKDGNYRWFLCLAIPLLGDKGNVIRWFGSATDIDELENQVAQRTSELSDLYNHAPCGYHSVDVKGVIMNINDTELDWLGYSREEIIGKRSFPDLLTPVSREAFTQHVNLVKKSGFVSNLEYEMIRKDGSILPVLLSATAMWDVHGEMVMTRATIIDHTQRKRFEQEIIHLNTILQEHGYNLEHMNSELEAFVYSISHDLRAPLRAINGFSKILLEEYKNCFEADGQKMLETVSINADRMRQLIDDLLRLSRASRQELNYTKIDMSALFNSMIEETKQHFPGRPVQFTLLALPSAQGDLALLKQVISNLLSNAMKFSGGKSVCEITIGALSGNADPTFYIKDNGTGFDMKFVQEAFGVFRRLSNAADFEGTGVGLAIVKRIIEKHGGRVWAESKPGEGATFFFTLPSKKHKK